MASILKDTTLRPYLFGRGIDTEVVKGPSGAMQLKAQVSPDQFKTYEHALGVMAQLSRVVYCDSGILRLTLVSPAFGTPDSKAVNDTITQLDKQYSSQRRTPSKDPKALQGRPMESYVLTPGTGDVLARYVSSPDDVTWILVKGSALSTKAPFVKPSDCVLVFKGSSTMKNFKHDLYSQFARGEISPGKFVPGSFLQHIKSSLPSVKSALAEFNPTRLFITGHSLGGAYATLCAYLLLLESYSAPLHLVTFGSPTLLSDGARNEFNQFLDSGKITFDRVVSQFGKYTDTISSIPAGYSHPGFQPLKTEFYPEARTGRAYYIDTIRKVYQQGGLFGVGAEKTKYETDTKTHMPNRVYVPTDVKAFPHAGYLGMTFWGAFRLAGMKNPGFSGNTFVADLRADGVSFQYVKADPSIQPAEEPVDNTPMSAEGAPADTGAARRTRRRRKGGRTRRNRF